MLRSGCAMIGVMLIHQLKQRMLASVRDYRVRELDQRVRSAGDSRRAVRLAKLFDELVCKAKLTAQNYFRAAPHLLIQLVNFFTQKRGICGWCNPSCACGVATITVTPSSADARHISRDSSRL